MHALPTLNLCRLQLRALKLVVDRLKKESRKPVSLKLVLIGGCRNQEDSSRAAALLDLAAELGISKHVQLIVNAPFSDVVSVLGASVVGLHSMIDEHFGISVVEYLAAGCIPIAHDSGTSSSCFVAACVLAFFCCFVLLLYLSRDYYNEFKQSGKRSPQVCSGVNPKHCKSSFVLCIRLLYTGAAGIIILILYFVRYFAWFLYTVYLLQRLAGLRCSACAGGPKQDIVIPAMRADPAKSAPVPFGPTPRAKTASRRLYPEEDTPGPFPDMPVGYLAHDEKTYASCILSAMGIHPDYRMDFARAGRKRAEKFSHENFAHAWLDSTMSVMPQSVKANKRE